MGVTARILSTHNIPRKNANGPGHPLYLLKSKRPQKDAAATPHAKGRSNYRVPCIYVYAGFGSFEQ
tara:strand:+ start:1923 stop:2120 length:198 start_codon:yes stop_codon:yes gene_type:complete